ncbi:hypothetical protein P3T76_013543 [Phytophthora citrophthora]|uniref:TOG domain-containing protein n=1 Tax=Phytophthora citrophthora TaxID=4793 RepID=A0AAD9LD12_9STRA|nr:hypothetical protein P3T76_013543 [Phytophthora citrophthora]
MPGRALLRPSSVDQNASASAAPKQKKSMLGRIRSKISKNLGRRKATAVASPTLQDVAKIEPKVEELVPEQQMEENNEEGDKNVDPEVQQPQNDKMEIESQLENDQLDPVLHFDAALPTLKDVANEMDNNNSSPVKRSMEQKCLETPEQVEENHTDEEEGETFASHTEEHEGVAEDETQQTPEVNDEEEEDTLELFDGEGNQQLESSLHAPEHEEDDQHDDNSNCPLEPAASMDLVVIGVTPVSLRNHIPCDDVSEEEEPLDTEVDFMATPRVNEPLSSPLKRIRPGPGVEVISSQGFYSSKSLPHPPLHDIREEDDSSPTDQSPTFHSLAGRRQTTEVSSTSQMCPQEDEFETPSTHRSEDGQTEEEQVDTETVDTGALITRAFGERIVNLLAADPWGDRQDGFDAIKRAVKKMNVSTVDSMTRQRLLCASLAAIQCGVEDRVAPVMFCALECFRAVLKEFARALPDDREFIDTEASSTAVLNSQLSSLVGALVKKLSDSNKRTQREATQALIRIARLRSLRAVPHLLLHLSGREVPPRRQLETLRRLIQELGLTNAAEESQRHQQLTVETVLQFVAPSLKIAEEKTRKAAVEILADVQARTANSTAWQAQLARAGAVKPEMLRVITRRVEELLAKREQQLAAAAVAPVAGSTTNQEEEQVDDEAAFPPAELVDVPQEDAQSSVSLLETGLSSAQNVVGPVCWRKLSSKTWSDRKEALLDVEKAMTEAKSDLRDTKPAFGSAVQGTFVAYCALLHRALSDNIAPVVNTALDAFATLVKIYGPRIEWRETDVRDVTLLALLRLLSAMQKPNTRTTRAACRGVLKLARLPNARHPLRYVLSCVFGGEGSSACDPQVQMHLLRLLVPEFGFQADGLGASRVLDAVSKGLVHNSARVRRAAADVALSAQRLLGRDFVLSRLQGVKPVTLKELEKSFVDGVGGSGGGGRPQTVHATAESSAPAPEAIGGTGLPPVTFGELGEFSSRRLLSSAPVGGVGRLQFTPLNEETCASPSSHRPSALSNEEENLMDSILGGGEF